MLVDFINVLPSNGTARFDEVDFQIAFNEMLEFDLETKKVLIEIKILQTALCILRRMYSID